jgi:Aldo/keto reductase family
MLGAGTYREDGLIAGIGLSNVSLEQHRHCRAARSIVCVQNLFHLADCRSASLLAECGTRGIAFVPFCPIGCNGWPQLAPNVLLIPSTGSVAHLREKLGSLASWSAEGVETPADDRRRAYSGQRTGQLPSGRPVRARLTAHPGPTAIWPL